MIRIVLITGDHPRHRYVANHVLGHQKDVHWIIQSREPLLPKPGTDLSPYLAKLADRHFQGRLEAEDAYFGDFQSGLDEQRFASQLRVSKEDLNSLPTLEYVRKLDPHLILSYGSHKLNERMTSLARWKALNIHGGLSPKYKGAATHFWPTYFLEPHWTGVTLHATTPQIDSGAIYLQTAVDLDPRHGIHENACQALANFCDKFGVVLENLNSEAGLPLAVSQKGVSREFRDADWNPHHLRLIYDTLENRVNAYCLESGLAEVKPALINVFESSH